MTSVRQGFKFCFEDKFKGGCGEDESKWIAPPPGSYFSNTSARNTTIIRGTGVKSWEVSASGAFNGSWEWTFMLDYRYMEPLAFIFENVNGLVYGKDNFGKGEAEQIFIKEQLSGYKFKYVFKKENNTRIPSFCVRRKILNRIAGGPDKSDEITELYGCIVQNISFSRSATTSQIQVTMSGAYADEQIILGNLDSTDYVPYDGQIAEYTCVMLGKDGSDELTDAEYVANTESLSISVQNNAGMTSNLCNAFAEAYYEGNVHYQITTAIYSNNPEMYKTRVYSGGYSNEKTRPMSKGLLPIPKMFVLTYTGEVDRETNTNVGSNPILNAYENSSSSIMFEITDAIVKSMKWQNGEGSKLIDSMSSVDCRDMSITLYSSEPYLLGSENYVKIVYQNVLYIVPRSSIRTDFELNMVVNQMPSSEELAPLESALQGWTLVRFNMFVYPTPPGEPSITLRDLNLCPYDSLQGFEFVEISMDGVDTLTVSGPAGHIGTYNYVVFKVVGTELQIGIITVRVTAA